MSRCAAETVGQGMTPARIHPAMAGRSVAEVVAAAAAAVAVSGKGSAAVTAAAARCMGCGIHCWQPETRLAPAPYKLGAGQAAGCMMLHPGTLWYLSAVEVQAHRMAALGLCYLRQALPVQSGQWRCCLAEISC